MAATADIPRMNVKDQELFLEMLLKLDGSHESIKGASKWCRANATYHIDITHMWFFAVAKARTMVRRLDLFHLASDILFTAEAHSIQYFSSFLPQLLKAVPLVRGDEIKLGMGKLFVLWREKNIYNQVVMDRLEKTLRNRNKVVDMNIFQYDSPALFANLWRVQELSPACDYLMRGLEHAQSFDNSSALLSSIKERRACQSLLGAVNSHKEQITSLVSFLEEMVHLLKMTTVVLDLAGNREQNCVEETKLKMMIYGRHKEKVLSNLHRLESQVGDRRQSIVDKRLFTRRSAEVVRPGGYPAESPVTPGYVPAADPVPERLVYQNSGDAWAGQEWYAQPSQPLYHQTWDPVASYSDWSAASYPPLPQVENYAQPPPYPHVPAYPSLTYNGQLPPAFR